MLYCLCPGSDAVVYSKLSPDLFFPILFVSSHLYTWIKKDTVETRASYPGNRTKGKWKVVLFIDPQKFINIRADHHVPLQVTHEKGKENIGADVSLFCDWQMTSLESLRQETGESGEHVTQEHKLDNDFVRIFRQCTAE